MRYVITQPCLNFNCGFIEPPLGMDAAKGGPILSSTPKWYTVTTYDYQAFGNYVMLQSYLREFYQCQILHCRVYLQVCSQQGGREVLSWKIRVYFWVKVFNKPRNNTAWSTQQHPTCHSHRHCRIKKFLIKIITLSQWSLNLYMARYVITFT